MKICQDHWQLMRDAIEERDMTVLVAKSGEAAFENEVRQLEEASITGTVSEQTILETFDPLMSMNWHWMNNALRCGGLYLMTGDHCPVCEFVKNQEGFDAKTEINAVADQMRFYCIEQKLIVCTQ